MSDKKITVLNDLFRHQLVKTPEKTTILFEEQAISYK